MKEAIMIHTILFLIKEPTLRGTSKEKFDWPPSLIDAMKTVSNRQMIGEGK